MSTNNTTTKDLNVSGWGLSALFKASTRFTKTTVSTTKQVAKPVVRTAALTTSAVLNVASAIQVENRDSLVEAVNILGLIAGDKVNEFNEEIVRPAMNAFNKSMEEFVSKYSKEEVEEESPKEEVEEESPIEEVEEESSIEEVEKEYSIEEVKELYRSAVEERFND
jgi:hypothetical protein